MISPNSVYIEPFKKWVGVSKHTRGTVSSYLTNILTFPLYAHWEESMHMHKVKCHLFTNQSLFEFIIHIMINIIQLSNPVTASYSKDTSTHKSI